MLRHPTSGLTVEEHAKMMSERVDLAVAKVKGDYAKNVRYVDAWGPTTASTLEFLIRQAVWAGYALGMERCQEMCREIVEAARKRRGLI